MASDRIWGNRDGKIVILDSSAVMMLFEFSIDLEGELTRLLGAHHITVPKPIIQELTFLSEKGDGARNVKARAALKLIEKYDAIDVKGKTGDDAVFALAKQKSGIVVTNDRELRKRLKEQSLYVIFLRAKKQLMIE